MIGSLQKILDISFIICYNICTMKKYYIVLEKLGLGPQIEHRTRVVRVDREDDIFDYATDGWIIIFYKRMED